MVFWGVPNIYPFVNWSICVGNIFANEQGYPIHKHKRKPSTKWLNQHHTTQTRQSTITTSTTITTQTPTQLLCTTHSTAPLPHSCRGTSTSAGQFAVASILWIHLFPFTCTMSHPNITINGERQG